MLNLRRTFGKSGRHKDVPQDPVARLQRVYDKVLRLAGPGRSRPVSEVMQILTALERDAFGGEDPDILRRSPEVNRAVAQELAAGRRVVVMMDGQVRFGEDGAV